MPRTQDRQTSPQESTVYWLPRNVGRILRSGKQTDNLGLALQRYTGTAADGLFDQKRQKLVLESTRRLASQISADPQGVTRILEAYRSRMQQLSQHCSWNGELRGTVAWRMVVGLGQPGLLEGSGMTVHPLYGFPYIPGSTVKGLCRSVALDETWEHHGAAIAEALDTKGSSLAALDHALGAGRLPEAIQGESLDSPVEEALTRLKRIFGSQEHRGEVVFFDAVPERFPKLDVDILNVHYPDYYQGSAPPSDWQDPRLVYFLAVGKGTEFLFYLGAHKTSDDGEHALRWLSIGLADYGVGGKKSAGYGAFDHISQADSGDRP